MNVQVIYLEKVGTDAYFPNDFYDFVIREVKSQGKAIHINIVKATVYKAEEKKWAIQFNHPGGGASVKQDKAIQLVEALRNHADYKEEFDGVELVVKV